MKRHILFSLALFLALISITISCQIDDQIQPKNHNPERLKISSVSEQPYLNEVLNIAGFRSRNKKNGRTNDLGFSLNTDSIIMVLQKDSKSYSYTFQVNNKTTPRSFTNFILKKVKNGFAAYYLKYETTDLYFKDMSSFNGTITRSTIEGKTLDIQRYIDGRPEGSNDQTNGRVNSCVPPTKVYYECEGLGPSETTGLPRDWLQDNCTLIIEFDFGACFITDSNGFPEGGAASPYYWNGGNFIPYENGYIDGGNGGGSGSGTGGGGSGGSGDGGETICNNSDPNAPCNDDNDAVIPPEPPSNKEVLNFILEKNPFFLIDIDCDELPKWKEVAQHTAPQEVLDKLNELKENQSAWSALIPYNTWDIQHLDEAEGTIVNMDFFSVTIDQLPKTNTGETMTPESFLDHIRKNINSFIDSTKADFEPFNDDENVIWQSDDYLGSIIHIDMGNDHAWLGGLNPSQPDDGSVICTKVQNNQWIFTTIQAPGDGQHPVSGNRQFGFVQNPDGTFSFFTRGVDRVTGTIDEIIQEYGLPPLASKGEIFKKGEQLWMSMQEKITNYINSHGGSASVNPENKVIARPDWNIVEEYFKDTKTIQSLGCK